MGLMHMTPDEVKFQSSLPPKEERFDGSDRRRCCQVGFQSSLPPKEERFSAERRVLDGRECFNPRSPRRRSASQP